MGRTTAKMRAAWAVCVVVIAALACASAETIGEAELEAVNLPVENEDYTDYVTALIDEFTSEGKGKKGGISALKKAAKKDAKKAKKAKAKEKKTLQKMKAVKAKLKRAEKKIKRKEESAKRKAAAGKAKADKAKAKAKKAKATAKKAKKKGEIGLEGKEG